MFQRSKPYALEGLLVDSDIFAADLVAEPAIGADRSQEGRYRLRAAVVARRKVPGVFDSLDRIPHPSRG